MPTAGAACRCRLIVTGFCSISDASAAIGGGIVALKNSVCRRGGNVPQDAADVGRKPMSSMRSASSSTRYSSAVELGVRRAEVIEQPARRGDDDVHAAAERVLLRAHADAAEDRGAGERRVHGERVEVLEDLRRQLARRRQHQRARRAARLARSAGAGSAAGTPRSCRCRSARRRARRGRPSPAESLGLDRRGPGEAELADAFEQIGMEAERGERHLTIIVFTPGSRPVRVHVRGFSASWRRRSS